MISLFPTLFNYRMPRKDIFKIRTSIVEDDTGKYIAKVADNSESMVFLQSLIQKELLAKKHFLNHAEVVNSFIRGSALYNPYLDYPNLENLIADAVTQDVQDVYGESRVKEYIGFIRRLPCQECLPEAFMDEFAISHQSVKKPLNCLLFGPIDLIPGNILVDKSIWYIIDHEWTYAFPVPVDFIIYRGIHSLIVHLQKTIQSHKVPDCPLNNYAGYINKTYIPSNWSTLLDSLQLPVRQFNDWEMRFQKKVLKKARRGFFRLKQP